MAASALVALAAVGLSIIPAPGPLSVTGDIAARSVSVRLDRDLDIRPEVLLGGLDIVVRHVSSIEREIETLDHSGSLVVRSATATRLSHVTASSRSLLSISYDVHRRFRMLVGGGSGAASIELSVSGPARVDFGERSWPVGENAEPFAISARGGPRPAVALDLNTTLQRDVPAADALDLGELNISELGFADLSSAADNSTLYVSTIESGTLNTIALDRTTSLTSGAAVRLTGLKGVAAHLMQTNAGMRVLFAGTVTGLEIGPAGFAKSQWPSVLNILVHMSWAPTAGALLLTLLGCLIPILWERGKDYADRGKERS